MKVFLLGAGGSWEGGKRVICLFHGVFFCLLKERTLIIQSRVKRTEEWTFQKSLSKWEMAFITL